MKRLHLWIEGRVQGVFYRASAHEEGVRLGLSGWVRNLSDGRVEALVQGPEEKVNAFVEWCKKGPPLARVTNVEVVEEAVENDLVGFNIRR